MNSGRLARAIATIGGFGDRVPAPGTTVGSLPAVVAWWVVCTLLPSHTQRLAATVIAAAVVTVIGVWASAIEARRRATDDPQPVVIDEVAGQWLTQAVVLALLRPEGARALGLAAGAGFLLFRLFDVVKPWPLRRLERIGGGVGIVIDDLVAGALAGLALSAVFVLLS